MIYTENVKKAALIALKAHGYMLDKGGMPYIFHPFFVAEKMTDEDSAVTALLHDVLEDTEITAENIAREGFSEKVIDALKAITKADGEDYFDYIDRVKQNETAKAVKLCDLEHNCDISRIESPTDRDFKRIEKYKRAIKILKGEY